MLALDIGPAPITATAVVEAARRYGYMLSDQTGTSLPIDEPNTAKVRDHATAELGPFHVVPHKR